MLYALYKENVQKTEAKSCFQKAKVTLQIAIDCRSPRYLAFNIYKQVRFSDVNLLSVISLKSTASKYPAKPCKVKLVLISNSRDFNRELSILSAERQAKHHNTNKNNISFLRFHRSASGSQSF